MTVLNTRFVRPLAVALLCAASLPAPAAPRALVPAKSEITFSVKQMGVEVSGKFQRFDARVELDDAKPESATAEVTVDIASLTTGDGDADAIALDKPWLDKAGFPKATFKSSSVKQTAPGRYDVTGTLDIRGKSREITVPLTTAAQADGATLASGEFRIRRADFGIGGGEWNEGDLVANEVPVKFKLWLAAP